MTVYNTLECHDMDILPFKSPKALSNDSLDRNEREEWKRFLDVVPEGDWCLFIVNVRNTYGMPFEVTFERDQEGKAFVYSNELVY